MGHQLNGSRRIWKRRSSRFERTRRGAASTSGAGAKNTLRGATSAATATIRDEAKSRAPVYTGDVAKGHPPPGTLKRSIVLKQIPERSGPLKQSFYVHVRTGKKYQKQGKGGNLSQDAYYWTWVEFGNSNMVARPFLRPAFEAKKLGAIAAFEL